MPDVSGLAWRELWRTIEPNDGSFDWTTLDAALDATATSGKQITIHIAVSGGAWPAWLTTAGAVTYSGTAFNNTPFTDPIPWDAVFINRYNRLIAQLAAHIATRGQTGLVRAVSVGAPVAEMSLVACTNGTLGTSGNTVAYSRSLYRAAWTSTGGAVAAAFPSTPVVISAPVPQICAPDGDGTAFYTDVMTSVPSAQIFVADLNALGSQRYAQVAAAIRARTLFTQTISAASNDPGNRIQGTLSQTVCAGRSLGARYFELYEDDLDSGDAAIRTAINQARGTVPCP